MPSVELRTCCERLIRSRFSPQIAASLLSSGADVDAASADGDSVLKFAFLCPNQKRALAFTRKFESQRASPATPLPFASVYEGGLESESLIVADSDRPRLVVPGSVRLVKMLLDADADPNISDAGGNFPLHWATAGVTVRATLRSVCCLVSAGESGSKPKKQGAEGPSVVRRSALRAAEARVPEFSLQTWLCCVDVVVVTVGPAGVCTAGCWRLG